MSVALDTSPGQPLPGTTELTRAQAAVLCGVSVDTIKRRQNEGLFPAARRVDKDQHWLITVADLVSAGLLGADRVQAPEPIAGADAPAAADLPAALAACRTENAGLRELVASLREQVTALREHVAFLHSLVDGRAA